MGGGGRTGGSKMYFYLTRQLEMGKFLVSLYPLNSMSLSGVWCTAVGAIVAWRWISDRKAST